MQVKAIHLTELLLNLECLTIVLSAGGAEANGILGAIWYLGKTGTLHIHFSLVFCFQTDPRTSNREEAVGLEPLRPGMWTAQCGSNQNFPKFRYGKAVLRLYLTILITRLHS